MKTHSVERIVDLANMPSPTEAERADLLRLREMLEDEIERSDIPGSPEEFWARAVSNPFHRPAKTSTTIRLDSDVLAWFKAQGRGYQSRINVALRRAMLEASAPGAAEGEP